MLAARPLVTARTMSSKSLLSSSVRGMKRRWTPGFVSRSVWTVERSVGCMSYVDHVTVKYNQTHTLVSSSHVFPYDPWSGDSFRKNIRQIVLLQASFTGVIL